MLAPLVRRSLAPRGQTPVLKQDGGHRQKVSAIAALSLSPKRRRSNLFFESIPNAGYDGRRTAAFLRHLLRRLPGRVIVVWDRGSHHRAKVVRDLLIRFPRLTIEYLPPYAPELNPVEFVWSALKWSKLANVCYKDALELDDWVMQHLDTIAQNPLSLRNYFKATPLYAALER
jgi:putative transposase